MSSDPVVLDTLPVSVMKYFEHGNFKKKAFVWGFPFWRVRVRHSGAKARMAAGVAERSRLKLQAGGREHTGNHDTLSKPQTHP